MSSVPCAACGDPIEVEDGAVESLARLLERGVPISMRHEQCASPAARAALERNRTSPRSDTPTMCTTAGCDGSCGDWHWF